MGDVLELPRGRILVHMIFSCGMALGLPRFLSCSGANLTQKGPCDAYSCYPLSVRPPLWLHPFPSFKLLFRLHLYNNTYLRSIQPLQSSTHSHSERCAFALRPKCIEETCSGEIANLSNPIVKAKIRFGLPWPDLHSSSLEDWTAALSSVQYLCMQPSCH